jgi:hypothetical protein
MSRDVEAFFEGVLGIRVLQVEGIKYSDETEWLIETQVGDKRQQFFSVERNITEHHQWTVLDFGLFSIPFESTALMPIDPMWKGFTDVKFSEGYYVGNDKVADTDDELEYADYPWK